MPLGRTKVILWLCAVAQLALALAPAGRWSLCFGCSRGATRAVACCGDGPEACEAACIPDEPRCETVCCRADPDRSMPVLEPTCTHESCCCIAVALPSDERRLEARAGTDLDFRPVLIGVLPQAWVVDEFSMRRGSGQRWRPPHHHPPPDTLAGVRTSRLLI